MTLKLSEHDTIVTAYAESAHGPGWSNTPVWVIVRNGDGVFRQECLQPEEQTADMRILFRVSESAHRCMTAAVQMDVKRVRQESVKRKGGK